MSEIKEAIALLKFFKDRKNTRLTTMIKIQSCIEELEKMQSMTCDNCSYLLVNFGICTKKVQLHDGSLPKHFYCKYHEAKG